MPLLGFTKLLDKLLDGSKTQTIRKPRKYPIKVGHKLYIYWKLRTKQCRKLGEGVATKTRGKAFCEINEKDAVLDGFNSLDELIVAFDEMHKPRHDDLFDIITWNWLVGPRKPCLSEKSPNGSPSYPSSPSQNRCSATLFPQAAGENPPTCRGGTT